MISLFFSKTDEEHLEHLRKVFEKCRKFGLSLNPEKTMFGLQEGKLLGHIISKEGIKIDSKRIEAILQITHPRNIKELQSFIGKINFLRRFIPNLAKLLRNITNKLKKEWGKIDLGRKEVLWTSETSINQKTSPNKSWFFKSINLETSRNFNLSLGRLISWEGSYQT